MRASPSLIALVIALTTLAGAPTMTTPHAAASETTAPRLDPARTALVFIEFQQEWIGEQARLRDRLVEDRAPFDAAVENAAQVLDAARTHGWTIAHAGLDLRQDPSYRLFGGGEGKLGLRGAIPRAGTWTGEGARFVPPFTPQPGEFLSSGRSGASVLKNATLDPFLRNNDIDTIVIMGFATHVCVESTLREAHDLGYNVVVVTDASAAFTAEQDRYFQEHVLHHFGAPIRSAELVEALAQAGQSSRL
jgi:biuret amidohydrolase